MRNSPYISCDSSDILYTGYFFSSGISIYKTGEQLSLCTIPLFFFSSFLLSFSSDCFLFLEICSLSAFKVTRTITRGSTRLTDFHLSQLYPFLHQILSQVHHKIILYIFQNTRNYKFSSQDVFDISFAEGAFALNQYLPANF